MSNRLRTLVVDDEPRARGLIRKMIGADPVIEIVGECGDGYEAVRAVRAGAIDLMLLDIQMPEMDGFAVLRELGGIELPVVIFVTAFDRYAIRAFEANALDYLLKPFDRERLYHSLHRARTHLRSTRLHEQSRQIADLLTGLKAADSYLDYLTVTSNGRMRLLPVSEIECLLAEDNYVRVRCSQGSYLLRDTLTRMATKLDPKQFLRVHRSAVVNLAAIRLIEPQFHGDHLLTLEGGKKLTLSRTYREAFFRTFGYSG